MIHTLKRIVGIILFFSIISGAIPFSAAATEEAPLFFVYASDNQNLPFDIRSYRAQDGEHYLFLPKEIEIKGLKIKCSFDKITSFSNCNYSDGYVIPVFEGEHTITVNGENLTLMQSSVPAMYITVEDGYTLETIQQDKNKKIRAKAEITGAGEYNLEASPIEIKTRGNSTFWMPKQPYQIKFDSKTNLFDMGKSKKWILLANYTDGTFVRNKVAYDLGTELGMPYTCQSVFVDLYIDGEYFGIFQLTEKVEKDKTRVPLEDDFGVLLEMDSYERYLHDEIKFFAETTGKAFVYKDYVTDFEETEDPEVIAKTNEVKEYIESYINTFEKELYTETPNWEKLSSMIDLESFIDVYFMSEFAMEADIGCTSTYFYMDGKHDVLHMGPLWDYDSTFGYYQPLTETWNNFSKYTSDVDLAKNIKDTTDNSHSDWYTQLFRIPEFAKAVNEAYDEKFKAVLCEEHVTALFENYKNELLPALEMNAVRWGVGVDLDTRIDNITHENAKEHIDIAYSTAEDYVSARSEYMSTAYGKYLPLVTFTPYFYSQCAVGIPFMPQTYDALNPTEFEYFYIEGNCLSYTGGQASLAAYDCFDWQSPINAFSIDIKGLVDGGIEYSFISGGEESEIFRNGEIAHLGELGTESRIQKIRIKLTGNASEYYSVQYRVAPGGKWSDWASDGQYIGTDEMSRQLYRIQIRIVKKQDIKFDTVTYCNTSGKIISTENIIYGNEAEPFSAPWKVGCFFDGWYDNIELEGDPCESIIAKGGKTYYAKYSPVDFIVGDVNADSALNIKDVLLLRRYIVGDNIPEDFLIERAYTVRYGKLSAKDLANIRRAAMGNISFGK